MAGWVILVAATIYCAAALTAAIALRRMRPWAVTAYICFVCSIACLLDDFRPYRKLPDVLGGPQDDPEPYEVIRDGRGPYAFGAS